MKIERVWITPTYKTFISWRHFRKFDNSRKIDLPSKSDYIEKPSWNIDLKITLIVVRFSGEKGLKLWKFETYYL